MFDLLKSFSNRFNPKRNKNIIPEGQDWMLLRMQAMGYPFVTEESGHCFGMAQMAKQACLLNDMDTFKNRLARIAEIPVSDFNDNLSGLEQQLKRYEIQYKKNKDVVLFKKIHQLQKDLIDIRAFFDGISVYQKIRYYNELNPHSLDNAGRSQTPEQAMSLLLPDKLKSSRVFDVVGAYTKDDLVDFLTILCRQLSQDCPVSLDLSVYNHTIELSYDCNKKTWILTDFNQLPPMAFNLQSPHAVSELANKIFGAMTTQEPNPNGIVMSTSVFTNEKDANNVQAHLDSLEKNETWSKLHAIERASKGYDQGCCVILLESELPNRDQHICEEIPYCENLESLVDTRGNNLLMLCSEFGHVMAVKELLNRECFALDAVNQFQYTAIDLCCLLGQNRDQIIPLLYAAGGRIATRTIQILCKLNEKELLSYLCEHQYIQLNAKLLSQYCKDADIESIRYLIEFEPSEEADRPIWQEIRDICNQSNSDPSSQLQTIEEKLDQHHEEAMQKIIASLSNFSNP